MKQSIQKSLITFGQNVKNARIQKNISLSELATLSGIRKEYLKKIESGHAPGVSTKHLARIAEALTIQMNELCVNI